MAGGEEAVGPVDRTARGELAGVGDDDEGRQVVGLAPQPVTQPGPHRREAVEPEAAVLLKRAGRVVGGLGDHRPDHRQLVGHRADVGEQLGDGQRPLWPLLAELPVRGLRSRPTLPKKTSSRLAPCLPATGRARRSARACRSNESTWLIAPQRQMWIARLRLGGEVRARTGRTRPGSRPPAVPSRSRSEAAAAPARPPPTQEKKPRRSVHIKELVAVEDHPGQRRRAEFFDEPDGPLALLGLGTAC